MKNNKTLKDIFGVFSGNIITLGAGILVAFILPKILSVEDYGFYKTFTLYISYIGLLHFGFCDGVYLKYGGQEYADLDEGKFRLYFKFLCVLELAVSVALIVITFAFLPREQSFIFYCIAVYVLLHNIMNYYQLLSQAVSRFGEYSFRTIVYAVLKLLGVVVMWGIYMKTGDILSYKLYVIILLIVELILTVWYIWTYRRISIGSSIHISAGLTELRTIIKIGFPLLITNLITIFIFALDRQFVNVLFDTATYAVYSFAYSLLSIVATVTSAIATVLYPKLKQTDEKQLVGGYSNLVGIILLIVFGGILVYFPLKAFIAWYLPKYTGSIEIFRIIFPGLAVSSAVSIIMYNYYKALNKTNQFFVISVIVLAMSALANYLAYRFIGTTQSISAASIIVMVLWYALSEWYFVKHYHTKWAKNAFYMLLMMAVFYGVTAYFNEIIGGVIYLAAFVGAAWVFYRKEILELKVKNEK